MGDDVGNEHTRNKPSKIPNSRLKERNGASIVCLGEINLGNVVQNLVHDLLVSHDCGRRQGVDSAGAPTTTIVMKSAKSSPLFHRIVTYKSSSYDKERGVKLSWGKA